MVGRFEALLFEEAALALYQSKEPANLESND